MLRYARNLLLIASSMLVLPLAACGEEKDKHKLEGTYLCTERCGGVEQFRVVKGLANLRGPFIDNIEVPMRQEGDRYAFGYPQFTKITVTRMSESQVVLNWGEGNVVYRKTAQ